MQELSWLIGHDVDLDLAAINQFFRIPFLELGPMIPAEMVQLVSHLRPKRNFSPCLALINSDTYINIGMNSSSVNVKQKVFQFLELGLMIPSEMVQLVSHLKPKSIFLFSATLQISTENTNLMIKISEYLTYLT